MFSESTTKSSVMFQTVNLLRYKSPWGDKESYYMMWLIVVLAVVTPISSQIVDVDYPIMYDDPKGGSSTRSTYFGYSLLLYSRNGDSWLVVGAPRSNSSILPKNREPGEVYRCGIKQICKPVALDDKLTVDSAFKRQKISEQKDDSWLGGSLALHPNKDWLSVCAPRRYMVTSSEKIMQGSCYVTNLNRDVSKINNVVHLQSLLEIDKLSIRWGKNVFYYAMGQMGISSYFTKLKNLNESSNLVYGAPGILNSKGSTILLESSKTSKQNDIDSATFKKANIPTLKSTGDFIDGNYLGYSGTSGYFFGKNKPLHHVSAAPRGSNCMGKIAVYTFPDETEKPPSITQMLSGDQIGSYFGASVASADFNGDGFDDLVVGAPYGTEPKVHIHLGNERGLTLPSESSTKFLKMTQWGRLSQFGAALATTDFNHDGFADVIVGAPEAESFGAIAIFLGRTLGIDDSPVQIIKSQERFSGNIRGFGISIAPPEDIDFNNYNDLAVGSYKSGHAVIFRAIPEAHLKAELKLIGKAANDTNIIQVEACLHYSWKKGFNASKELAVERTLVIDRENGRATLVGSVASKDKTTYKHTRRLRAEERTCELLQLRLNASPNLQYLKHMDVTINVVKARSQRGRSIIQVNSTGVKGEDLYDKWDPNIVSSNNEYTHTISIPLQDNCGNDNICTADLNVQAFFPSYNKKGFIVGSTDIINLEISVENTGEPAYVTKIEVVLPQDASPARTPSFCRTTAINIICSVGNPLLKGKKENFVLEIDMRRISESTYEREIRKFIVNATTGSNEADPINNVVEVSLQLDVDSRIVLAGKSQKDTYSLNETNGKTFEEYVEFEHTYEVQKAGISDVPEVLLNMKIPYKFYKQNEEIVFLKIYKPRIYHDGQEHMCDSSDYVYAQKEIGENEDEEIASPDLNPAAQMKRSIADSEYFNSPTESDTIYREFTIARPKRDMKEITLNELPENRTISLSCNIPEVRCATITCHVGPLHRKQPVAKLVLSMSLNITTLKDRMMGVKDIIVFTSKGEASVTKTNGGKVSAEVKSVFVTSPPQQKVELWVIILSVVLGILLVLLITFILVKIGFFQRKKKEQLLEELKKKAAADTDNMEKIDIVDDLPDADLEHFEIEQDHNFKP